MPFFARTGAQVKPPASGRQVDRRVPIGRPADDGALRRRHRPHRRGDAAHRRPGAGRHIEQLIGMLAKRSISKRGPAPKLQQQLERVQSLPTAQ